uniref:Uncharacterized protein n=1 Tax=Oryza meridionalis TaxID=40149 RepID=A0A0E0EPK9_9ORYZ
MFCGRAAASSLEILPAWTAAARAADSSLPPEPVLLPRVDCRRIPAAGAAASSPPRPVPTSAPSATAGADFPPPPAPTSSSSAAVPIPSPIPSIPIISCRSPPSTLPHNPILYQKSKTTSIGMETSCFRERTARIFDQKRSTAAQLFADIKDGISIWKEAVVGHRGMRHSSRQPQVIANKGRG